MTSSKGPNELPPNGKKPATRAISIGYWRYTGKTSFSNLPPVRTVSGEESGILRGKSAVRDYWRRILKLRPDLDCAVGHVFAGVDSVALEYRFANGLHGIEFMTVDADGLVSFAGR
jgi:SnoaL-like domain